MSDTASPATKPGIMTTEFWAQLTAQIVNLCVGLNLLSPADVPSIETTISKVIAAAILICTNAIVVIHYVDGRISLKRSGGTSGGSGIPSAAPAMIALIIAGLFVSSAEAAWPPKFSLFSWRKNTTNEINALKATAEEHGTKIDDHSKAILSLKLDAPKQPPAAESPQRLSIWEPALYRPTFGTPHVIEQVSPK